MEDDRRGSGISSVNELFLHLLTELLAKQFVISLQLNQTKSVAFA
jgi:hypothetical protein